LHTGSGNGPDNAEIALARNSDGGKELRRPVQRMLRNSDLAEVAGGVAECDDVGAEAVRDLVNGAAAEAVVEASCSGFFLASRAKSQRGRTKLSENPVPACSSGSGKYCSNGTRESH
jgi:hypothetical protein